MSFFTLLPTIPIATPRETALERAEASWGAVEAAMEVLTDGAPPGHDRVAWGAHQARLDTLVAMSIELRRIAKAARKGVPA